MSVKKGFIKSFKRTAGNAERLAATTHEKTHDKKKGRREVRHSAISRGAGILLPSGGEAPFSETPAKSVQSTPVNVQPVLTQCGCFGAYYREAWPQGYACAARSRNYSWPRPLALWGGNTGFVFKYGEPHVARWSGPGLMEIVWFGGDARSCMAGPMGFLFLGRF